MLLGSIATQGEDRGRTAWIRKRQEALRSTVDDSARHQTTQLSLTRQSMNIAAARQSSSDKTQLFWPCLASHVCPTQSHSRWSAIITRDETIKRRCINILSNPGPQLRPLNQPDYDCLDVDTTTIQKRLSINTTCEYHPPHTYSQPCRTPRAATMETRARVRRSPAQPLLRVPTTVVLLPRVAVERLARLYRGVWNEDMSPPRCAEGHG